MKARFLIACAVALVPLVASGGDYSVKSPSGILEMRLSTGNETLWSLYVDGAPAMEGNRISMTFSDGTVLGLEPAVRKAKKTAGNSVIEAPFYRQSTVKDEYNGLILNMRGGYSLEVRAYDDGVAYRWITSFGSPKTVVDEEARFLFTDAYPLLVPFAQSRPNDRFMTSFESAYTETFAGDVETAAGRFAIMPLYADLGGRGRLLLMESDIEDYPGMFLSTVEGGYEAVFPRFPENPSVQDGRYRDFIVETAGTRTYPWRIVAYGRDECEAALNDMVYKLAAPNRIGDVSWIKPGQSAWDWWNGVRRHGVPFKAGINTETYRYDIDFAAAHGMRYVLVDDGWYSDRNMMKPIPGLDIPALCSYGASKGVGIILWASKGVFGVNTEQTCAHYAALGVAGFKVDFFDAQDAAITRRLYRYAEIASRYSLVLDFHGVPKPAGLSRTYPNVLNYEGVLGLEHMKWSGLDQVDMPLNDVTIPFVRQACGPMDYTPGALRNGTRNTFRVNDLLPMSQGTRAHQVAEYIVFDAPLAMLCDSPSDYLREEETTGFITSIPTVFDSTVILSGKIGEYIITLRRSGGKWFVGGLSSWEGRDAEVDLSFLPEGKWLCRLFRDGENADAAADDYVVESFSVGSGDSLRVKMSPGGGFAMVISRE